MNVDEMKDRLTAAYCTNQLSGSVEVFDLTGGQNHWEVHIESQAFRGLNRIQQHQHVMSLFKDELKSNHIHALSIKTKIKE